jgi:ketosteroid isomerase-like protein
VGDPRAPSDPRAVAEAFAERLNARDLDGLVVLFADESIIVPQPGQVEERAAVRDALAQFVALGVPFNLSIRRVFAVGDTALVIGDWTMTGTGPDGSDVDLAGTTADVVRRQPDGSWRYLIDNPFGTA